MTDINNPVDLARENRAAAYAAATLWDSLSKHDNVDIQQPDWETLLSIPDWCFWPEDKRHALASTAGALFLAPVLRLWIDAKRIISARQILGDSLFDAIMQYQTLPQVVKQPSQKIPVKVLFLSTGSSVLLGSLTPALQQRLASLLPPPAEPLQHALAQQLAAEAQSLLLRLTAEYIATQEQEVVTQ